MAHVSFATLRANFLRYLLFSIVFGVISKSAQIVFIAVLKATLSQITLSTFVLTLE